jgi:hypothetical protein
MRRAEHVFDSARSQAQTAALFLSYLTTWVVADLLAYLARFGTRVPDAQYLIMPIVQVAALVCLFVWTSGRSSRASDLVVMAMAAEVASIAIDVDVPRSFLTLQLVLGIVALLTTRALTRTIERG